MRIQAGRSLQTSRGAQRTNPEDLLHASRVLLWVRWSGGEWMTIDIRTRVMLVDDHAIMRDLLRDALENTGDFQVVAQAADGQEALRLVAEAAPT